MSALLETLSGLKRKLQITVPADEMGKKYQSILSKQAQNANIKGFRPGKVPMNVVERYYGEALRAKVREDMIQKSFTEAMEKEDFRLAGQPDLTDLPEWEKGKDLVFEVQFEIYPTVGDITVDGLAMKDYGVNVSDADIDTMIGNLQKQHVEWSEVDRAAQDGDKLTVDFAGSINDVPFDGGTATDFDLVLGDKRMIEGFEEGLVGIEKDVTRELRLVFPEEYHAKELAGQPVEFQVTAKKVEEPVSPELNDEFAKKVGFESLEKLKEGARNKMEEDAQSRLKAKQKQELLDQLVEKHDFDLPEVLMEGELKYLRTLAHQQAEARHESVEEGELESEEFSDQAKKRVKLGILLSEIVRQFDITLDQKTVEMRVRELALGYPNPKELIEWLYKDRSRLMEIETSVLEDQAVAKLLEGMELETTVVDYDKVADFVEAE